MVEAWGVGNGGEGAGVGGGYVPSPDVIPPAVSSSLFEPIAVRRVEVGGEGEPGTFLLLLSRFRYFGHKPQLGGVKAVSQLHSLACEGGGKVEDICRLFCPRTTVLLATSFSPPLSLTVRRVVWWREVGIQFFCSRPSDHSPLGAAFSPFSFNLEACGGRK